MPTLHSETVRIGIDDTVIEGALALPAAPFGVILFAHGSGSSRLSPRNNFVASQLQQAGMGTLLIDLLSTDEARDVRKRFDIALLAQRLDGALRWLGRHPVCAALPVGLFGASTGAAAAMCLAGARRDAVAAIVSRGGRPDLAGTQALLQVAAPTLLIVGGRDDDVLRMNRIAYAELLSERRLAIVPGATHLFEEAGALEAVAALAVTWFADHLRGPSLDHEAQPAGVDARATGACGAGDAADRESAQGGVAQLRLI